MGTCFSCLAFVVPATKSPTEFRAVALFWAKILGAITDFIYGTYLFPSHCVAGQNMSGGWCYLLDPKFGKQKFALFFFRTVHFHFTFYTHLLIHCQCQFTLSFKLLFHLKNSLNIFEKRLSASFCFAILVTHKTISYD